MSQVKWPKPGALSMRSLLLASFAAGTLAGAAGLTAYTSYDDHLEAQRLGGEVANDYVSGNSGFTIIREFYEQNRERKLVEGVQILDGAGQAKNRYPRGFTPAGHRFEAPIIGADGINRGMAAAYFSSVFPPFNFTLLFWSLMGGFAAAALAAFVQASRFEAARLRIVALEKEAALERLRVEALEKEAALERMVAEQLRQDAQINRMSDMWGGVRVQLSDEAGRVNNHLQEMDGFIAQLKINLNDAVHDLYKAPLVATGPLNVTGDDTPVTDVKAFLRRLEDRSVVVTQEQITDFVRNVDQTMDSVKWVIDGLPEFANLRSEAFDPCEQLEMLMEKLPPNLRTKKWLTVHVDAPNPVPPISFNRVHFRNVVKNALYNASGALQERRLASRSPAARQEGRIQLQFVVREGEVGLVIEDNGPGLSDAALARLYHLKVDPSSDNTNGRGSVIVAAYLEFHEARVEVANREEGGARVTFWFKQAQQAVLASGEVEPIQFKQVGA